ncbi:LytTR family DNA-binding domain-containing protein [Asticcacaulis machinosus]|uniref:LytTR family DNA-binding domain-containing protein n=1 Tax=Asticcacaulis machinosus TaxID=2984211 RepID=A0ABT5HKW8_9CAUL|nr:LytTR family DNA-binding domain-containing protein [Asticcacaulis machinosus]MDC7676890.1 LytTR family DNA-binding domain-containing protein [Asticcacaulis machinosus]
MPAPMRETAGDIREMPATAVRASRITEALMPWAKTYGIAIGMALFLTAIAASGTDVFDLPARFLYWASLMIGGTFIAHGVSFLMDRIIPGRGSNGLRIVIHLVLIIVPITAMVWVANIVINGVPLPLKYLPHLLGAVAPICVAMTTLYCMANRTPMQSHAHAVTEVVALDANVFRQRLPFKFRSADLYALSAEDHYLRVHTSAGQTLILMRLYDAIRELDGIEGSQTHRSWWVAKDAIEDVSKEGGRVTFRLKGQVSAPVSRSFQKALKTDGWL